MQVQISIRCHHIPIRVAKIKRLTIAKFGKDVEHQELLDVAGGSVKLYNHTGKLLGNFSKVKQTSACPKTQEWHYKQKYQRDINAYIHKKATKMFLAVLLIIASKWK